MANTHLGLLRSLLEDTATVQVIGSFVEVRVSDMAGVLRVGLDIGATADLCYLMDEEPMIAQSVDGFVIHYAVALFDLSMETGS